MPLFHATLKQTNLNKKNSRSTLITRLKLKAQSLPGWKKECKVLYALCLESKDEFLGLNSLNAAKKQEEEHLSVSELQDSRMKNRTNRLPNHQGIGMVNLIRWETVLPGPQRLGRLPKPTNPNNPSPFSVLAKSQDPKGEKSEHQVAQDTTGIQNQKNHAPHQNNQQNDKWRDDLSWLKSVHDYSEIGVTLFFQEHIRKRYEKSFATPWIVVLPPVPPQPGLSCHEFHRGGCSNGELTFEAMKWSFLWNCRDIDFWSIWNGFHQKTWSKSSPLPCVTHIPPKRTSSGVFAVSLERFSEPYLPRTKYFKSSAFQRLFGVLNSNSKIPKSFNLSRKKENSHRDETRISKKKTSEMLVWKLPLTILAKKLRIDFQSQASTSESNNTSGIRQSPSADIAFAGRTDHGSLSEKLSRTKSAPESYASARSVQGSCRHATAAVQGEFCIFEWNVLTLLRFQMATPNALKMANT